jgi:hypothetical protein
MKMANRYRILAGNWNDVNCWSSISGGSGGASVPTSVDDVFFDSNTPNGTHTVNIQAHCKKFDCTGWTGTLAGNQLFNLYGDLTFSLGVTHTSTCNFVIRGECSLTTVGQGFNRIEVQPTGELTLQDDLILTGNYTNQGFRVLDGGNFVHNNKKVKFSSTAPNNFIQGYGIVFYDLEKEERAVGGTLTLQGYFTVENDFKVTAYHPTLIAPAYKVLVSATKNDLNAEITCNGIVTILGCDLWRIVAKGTASWNLTSSPWLPNGDCGGNSGITFVAPINTYWVHGASTKGFWMNSTFWKTESGGSVQARYPLPQDTAIFDENSFPDPGKTVDMGWTTLIGKTVWQNVTNNPVWEFSGSLPIFGSVQLDTGMSMSGNGTFLLSGYGQQYLDMKGIDSTNKMIPQQGSFYTLLSNLKCDQIGLDNGGGWDLNDFDVFARSVAINTSNYQAIYLRSGTLSFNAGPFLRPGILNVGINSNWHKGTATIIFRGDTDGEIQFLNVDVHKVILEDGAKIYFRGSGGYFDNYEIGKNCVITTYNTNTITVQNLTIGEGTTIDGHGFTKTGGGTIAVENITLKNSVTSPVNTFFAINSVDLGGNTNWTFQTVSGWAGKIFGIEPNKVNGIDLENIEKILGV